MFRASGFNHCNNALVTMWTLLQLEPTVLPQHSQMFILILSALMMTSHLQLVNLHISQHCLIFALCREYESKSVKKEKKKTLDV